MIRALPAIINLRTRNISIQEMNDRFLSEQKDNPEAVRCRKCYSTKTRILQKYTRHLTDYIGGRLAETEFTTMRYRCESCGSTHVYMCTLIVPYLQFSIALILFAMDDYFSRRLTIVHIREKYQISVPTLYRWEKIYLKHRDAWTAFLNHERCSASDEQKFISCLCDGEFSRNALKFIEIFPGHPSFLQSRRNADNQRYG